jgi:peptidoglycan hydrolase-like protein with peptidoglycan-binding domain
MATHLQEGSRGPGVRKLQEALNLALRGVAISGLRGTPLVIDGIFGPITRECVMKFKTAVGLVADGIVGPRTAKALLGAVLCALKQSS